MPRSITRSLVFLILLLLYLPSSAGAALQLKVGIYDYKPLVYLDSDKNPAGFFVDILKHVAVNENWTISYIPGTWQEGLERLESGKIDLLLCFGYSEERALKYDFPSEALLTDWGVVYRRKDQPINTIMDMEGKTVAVLKGSIFSTGFQQLASQFNVNVKIFEVNTISELFSEATYRVADAIVNASIASYSYADEKRLVRTPINFSPVKIGIGAAKGKNGAVLKKLNDRIRAMKDDKGSIYYRKLDELTSNRQNGISPIMTWSLTLLGGGFLIAVAFVITLTQIVKRKTEGIKRYSRELEKREEQFRLAMTASRDGLWDWNVVSGELYFSPGYFRMIGFEPYELTPEFSTWAERIHPDDYEQALQANTECIEGVTESFSVEFRMLAKNGDWVWILGRGAAVSRRSDGRATRMIGTHTDISGLVAARSALRASEERLKLATSAAHLGIWDWSLQTNELIWNDMAFEIYGVSRTEASITKKVWEEAIHKDDRNEAIGRLNGALAADDFFESEYRIVRPDDSVRSIKTYCAVIRENGSAIRVIGVINDVTERRMLEMQIRHTQKMDAVGRLAGGIAHDFNNKLTVILGYAELMKMLDCTAESKCDSYLDEITKAANHSQEITRKLLAFSRDESLEVCKIDINHTLAEMKRTLGRLIGEHYDIRFEYADGLWPILMNPTEYDQIIMNLALNARDAMPDGGRIVITTANETVVDPLPNSCMHSMPGEYAVTAIRDSGYGISREMIERIFDPFFTTKPTGKGTGLGLSTVYGIVSRCKGFITVDSEPGEGSIFSIYLPKMDDLSEQAQPVENMAHMKGNGIILLVEDEEAVRSMTQLFLESIGYRVIVSDNPMHAIKLCELSELTINCVLSDVIMPDMNGKQLQERINAIRPGLPFLFMSGYTADILTEHGVVGQGQHFISKPLNFKALHDKLAFITERTVI